MVNRILKKTLRPLLMEPLQGSGLLFPTKFPEIPGTHFIDFGELKG